MKQLIEFPLESSGVIHMEADIQEQADGKAPPELSANVVVKASLTLEAALEKTKPVAAAVINALRTLADGPNEITVEFGLRMSSEIGVVVTSGFDKANYRITLKWKPERQAEPERGEIYNEITDSTDTASSIQQDRARVTFSDFTGAKHADVTLKLDLTTQQVIERLQQANFLPASLVQGQEYVLSLQRSNQQIAPNQTLRSAGVRDGDTIIAAVITRGGCFPAGTQITMADGTYKPIEMIEVGHKVSSFDIQKGSIETSQVTRTFKASAPRCLLINEFLRVTESHLVLANGVWTRADNLQIGDILWGYPHRDIRVDSITFINEEIEVYNLHLSENGNFFAHDVLVHNSQ